MNKQMTQSGLSDELAQVRTKKKEFLAQIERIIPWGDWLSLIKPCYYKGESTASRMKQALQSGIDVEIVSASESVQLGG